MPSTKACIGSRWLHSYAVICLRNLSEKSFSIKPPSVERIQQCCIMGGRKAVNSIISPIQACIVPINYNLIYLNPTAETGSSFVIRTYTIVIMWL